MTAVGFTVKSGWTSVVLLQEATDQPVVRSTRRLELCDSTRPEARQPYHAGFATARSDDEGLRQLVAEVERFGTRAVTELLLTFRAHPADGIVGAGIVVGSLIDPDTIANPHIRIHALEGRLFRGCIEAGAQACTVPTHTWRERDLYGHAARVLHRSEPALRATLAALDRPAKGGWRAEHKAAALAAWLVLHHAQTARNA